MVDELKKITVDTLPEQKPMQKKKAFQAKYVLIPLGILVVFVAIVGIMLLPLRGVISKGREVAQVGKETATALKNQDLAKTKEGLAKTRVKFTELSKEYGKVTPLKFVPILGAYVNDGTHGINAGFAALDAADRASEALEPNADLLGFTGGSKFVMGSADERIQ